jgi:hypothetical protein
MGCRGVDRIRRARRDESFSNTGADGLPGHAAMRLGGTFKGKYRRKIGKGERVRADVRGPISLSSEGSASLKWNFQ